MGQQAEVLGVEDVGAVLLLTDREILLNNDEVAELPGYLRQLRDCGVDAFIVADMGVFLLARREVPPPATPFPPPPPGGRGPFRRSSG